MTVIIGILAMFVAFAALWLGGMAMKKADDQFTELASALRAELSKVRGEMDSGLKSATQRIESLERRVDEVQTVDVSTREMLDVIRRELIALKEDLSATQTALPPQYRRRGKGGEAHTNN